MDPHSNAAAESSSAAPRRKFVPELVESTTRSSRAVPQHNCDQASSKATTGRLRPQLIGTSTKHHGKGTPENKQTKQDDGGGGGDNTAESNTLKKFSPQLIETAKRSFRQPPASSRKNQYRNPATRSGRKNATSYTESPFSYASLVRRQDSRRHSFRVPDLPAIPSTSSEDSAQTAESSISTSPPSVSNEIAQKHNVHVQPHETYPDPLPDHLLALSSRSAEKLLKDQALAAFPNEQVHQRVSHFAIDREDDDIGDEEEDDMETAFRQMSVDLARFRRASTVDLAWELEEMRRHKEESEMRARERMFVASQSKFSAAAIAERQAAEQPDATQTERSTSPPMLGDDIVFPQCLSPQATRCDTDQTAAPHDEEDGEKRRADSDVGLWTASIEMEDCGDAGLWNGTCQRTSQTDTPQLKVPETGLITPGVHSLDVPPPISSKRNSMIPKTQNLLPITPPDYFTPSPLTHSVDKTLDYEEEIKREFHDDFITQIYNYLSLGYPCLARDFDAELSKITSISIEELQKDDQHVDAKGYVGAPEHSGAFRVDGTVGEGCMRWSALKLYIHEWARQQPRSSGPDSPVDPWGFRERKGSWGV